MPVRELRVRELRVRATDGPQNETREIRADQSHKRRLDLGSLHIATRDHPATKPNREHQLQFAPSTDSHCAKQPHLKLIFFGTIDL